MEKKFKAAVKAFHADCFATLDFVVDVVVASKEAWGEAERERSIELKLGELDTIIDPPAPEQKDEDEGLLEEIMQKRAA